MSSRTKPVPWAAMLIERPSNSEPAERDAAAGHSSAFAMPGPIERIDQVTSTPVMKAGRTPANLEIPPI